MVSIFEQLVSFAFSFNSSLMIRRTLEKKGPTKLGRLIKSIYRMRSISTSPLSFYLSSEKRAHPHSRTVKHAKRKWYLLRKMFSLPDRHAVHISKSGYLPTCVVCLTLLESLFRILGEDTLGILVVFSDLDWRDLGVRYTTWLEKKHPGDNMLNNAATRPGPIKTVMRFFLPSFWPPY